MHDPMRGPGWRGLHLRGLRPRAGGYAAIRLAAAGVLALAIGACGQDPAPRYFPLDEGWLWTYRVSEHNPLVQRRRPLTLENLGTRELDGQRYWRRRSSEGNEYWLEVVGDGVQRRGVRTWLDAEPARDEPAQTVLPARLVAGAEWNAQTRPYILERALPFRERFAQDDSKTVDLRMRLASLDDRVEVPAGTFEHCLRVEGHGHLYVLADARIGASEVPVAQTEWYCPDVGLVKLQRRETLATEQIVGGEITLELVQLQR